MARTCPYQNCDYEQLANEDRFCPACEKPIYFIGGHDYTELIADRTRDFIGREWVFEKVNGWLEKKGKRFYWLSGGPGSGKTALAARLVQMSLGAADAFGPKLVKDCLAHYHFCRAFNEETLNPLAFVRHLSIGLASRYPAFAQALSKVQAQGVTINFNIGYSADYIVQQIGQRIIWPKWYTAILKGRR